MAESLDTATSDLLCPENSKTCFADFECNAANESEISPSWNHRNISDNHEFESLLGFPIQSEERVRLMTEREREHLPRDDYLKRLRSGDLDLSVRREALDWIWKVG